MTETEPNAHPLFPANDPDDDPPEVFKILVKRDGKQFPRAFDPEELTSLEQIYDTWGGGTYELTARDRRAISAKQFVTLPGKPRPFLPEEGGEEPSPTPAAPTAPPVAMVAPTSDGGGFSAVLPFMQMMAQMMMQQSQQQSQMLIALMTSGREQAQQHLQQMQMMHDRSMTQQMQMMQTMFEAQKGSRPDELILRGIELANQLTAGSGGDDSDASELGEIAESLGNIMQGVQGFQAMTQPPAAPPNGQSTPPQGPVQ